MTRVNPNSRVNQSWGADELNRNNNANGTKKGGAGILEERSGLSVDDFLKIMAAEMQNQNPMGNGDGGGGSKTDYVSQLAQFTSLELMGEVVENLNYINAMSQQQYAFTLIGKEVSVRIPDLDEGGRPKVDSSGNVIMKDILGTVESVKFINGVPMAKVRDEKDKIAEYDLGSIMEVAETGGIEITKPGIPLEPSIPNTPNTD